MLAALCQWVGAVALASVLVWLVIAAVSKLRPLRLLDNLPSRAVLITGCDSGFGNGVARRLDTLGVPVFAGCLFPEGPGARKLAADCSSRLRVLPLDVTSDQQVADAVVSVEAALKEAPGTELWAVLNNAGIIDGGEVDVMPLEKFQKVLDVNTVGPIRVSKAFLPLLKKSKGRLVNVNSPAGRVPVPLISPYCVSKSATIMFGDVLRLEMEKWSVAVCSIEPTVYGTAMSDVECLQSKVFENMEKTVSGDKESIREAVRNACEARLKFVKFCTKSNISEAIDEMVAACIGRNVQRKHIPGLGETILYTTLEVLPDSLRDFLIHLMERLIKLTWG